MSNDTAFTGSVPEIYETCLVPALFAPYGRDLAARAGLTGPSDVLEIAAGTGAVTRLLAAALPPGSRLVATDLNQAMLDVAAARLDNEAVTFQAADAQALPFANGSFDLAVCQFGVMFFPDRPQAHAEVRRVLRPGGRYLFNVWNRLEDNLASLVVQNAVAAAVPAPKPSFLPRVPFGYHDPSQIEADLHAGGFTEVSIERVDFEQSPDMLAGLANGLCSGSPLAAELAAFPEPMRRAAAEAASAAVDALAKAGPVTMSALVVSATG